MKTSRVRILAVTAILAVAAGCSLADTRIEKTLELSPGGKFVLDSEGGSVKLTGTSGSGVRIVITSKRDDLESLANFTFEGGSEMARVTMKRVKTGGWNRGLSLGYEIEVPNHTQLDIRTSGGSISTVETHGEAKLRTSGGSIKVSDLEGPLDASTSGGSIVLNGIVGDARVSTSGGSIRGSHVEGSLDAETSGGSIQISEAGGAVNASTSGGSLTVAFSPGNQAGGSLQTSGGGIRVKLDATANLDLDAHCSGGSVKTDMPVTVVGNLSKNTLKGAMGSGGATLKLRTSGGSIRIEAM